MVALVPAALVFALVTVIGQLAVPWTAALPLAAAAAALILGCEAALGVALLGKVFDRFDLSIEA
jgi:hypothetical protein